MSVPFHGSLPAGNRLLACLSAALLLCACTSGCVTRRMTIRTNPPGARVYVDDYEIGTTPVSHNFIYYGTRKVRLVKDGYETLTTMETIPPPWYQIPPLDFVSENLMPTEIRDNRCLTYNLTPQMVVPPELLLQRAENLRRGVQPAGGAQPSGPAAEPIPTLIPGDPNPIRPPVAPEPIPTPPGIGGQPTYPLPPGGGR